MCIFKTPKMGAPTAQPDMNAERQAREAAEPATRGAVRKRIKLRGITTSPMGLIDQANVTRKTLG